VLRSKIIKSKTLGWNSFKEASDGVQRYAPSHFVYTVREDSVVSAYLVGCLISSVKVINRRGRRETKHGSEAAKMKIGPCTVSRHVCIP